MKHIEFKATDLIKGSILKGGTTYDYVRLKNTQSQNTLGNPDLPVYYYTFYVPMNEKAISVTFKSKKQETISLSNILMPSQRPIPTSLETRDTTFSLPNQLIYESDNVYPIIQARIINTDYLDGDLKLVTVEIYPMQYFPKSKKIIYSTQFEFKLETTQDDNTDGRKIHPKKREKEIISVLKSMVENPQTISLDSGSIAISSSNTPSKVQAKVSTTTAWTVPFYEYVIVTSNALRTSFNDLVTWKRQKGYNAGIVTIEDILADPVATGDVVSGLYDNAGKLRQYLKAGYESTGNTKTVYALLGGDYTVVPIRYGYGSFIPSDIYFSDLTGYWDPNGYSYEYGSEIYVGRLLCSSATDVATWTRKQLKYEQNPGNGDYGYLKRVLFTEMDELQQQQQGEYIKNYLPPFMIPNTVILGEQPSYDDLNPSGPTGSSIITNINTNLYGLLSNFNHGGTPNYGTTTHGINLQIDHSKYVVCGLDSYDDNITAIVEPGNGFDNLTNYDYPAVFYSVSCVNMPFDDFSTAPGKRNLAEAFTCMVNGGGVAYLGNTRDGWVNTSYLLYKSFLDRLPTTTNLGKAEALSKLYCSDTWTKLTHNLVGCPETPMWTASPTLFSGASVSLTGSNLTVVTGTTGAKICVSSGTDGGLSYFDVHDNVSSYTFMNVPSSYKVVITKTNYIPYMYSSDYYIQNETYSGTTTINANNVTAGSNVTTIKPTGPVTIQTGANVTIDANGNTIINDSFEVQSGGVLEIK